MGTHPDVLDTSRGTDDQAPHHEDEIYVVMGGRAILTSDSASAAVQPGSVLYVPAGENHTFAQITGDLGILIVAAVDGWVRGWGRSVICQVLRSPLSGSRRY